MLFIQSRFYSSWSFKHSHNNAPTLSFSCHLSPNGLAVVLNVISILHETGPETLLEHNKKIVADLLTRLL